MNFHDRLRRLGFSSYADYLKSAHWKSFCKKHKKRECFCCGERRSAWSVEDWERHQAANSVELERMIEAESDATYSPDCVLEVHHITYDRLGWERAEDVVTVCDICHLQIHTLAKYGDAHLSDAHIALRERKLANRKRCEEARVNCNCYFNDDLQVDFICDWCSKQTKSFAQCADEIVNEMIKKQAAKRAMA